MSTRLIRLISLLVDKLDIYIQHALNKKEDTVLLLELKEDVMVLREHLNKVNKD